MTHTQSAPAGPTGTTDIVSSSSSGSAGEEDIKAILDERARRARRRLERLIGVAATEGNALVPLRNGDEIFTAMLDGISSARHTVDMMTFVYWKGEIAQRFAYALADRAREGCGCAFCWTVLAVGSSRRISWR